MITSRIVQSGLAAMFATASPVWHRETKSHKAMRPSNLPLSFIGACLLWIGWFGFNAGSALTASSLAASAFTVTHFVAAAGVMGWLAVEWIRNRRPSMLASPAPSPDW